MEIAENKSITRGLLNYRNSCWLNSIIQCLGQTPDFLEDLNWILENNSNPQILPGGILTKTNNLELNIPPLEITAGKSLRLTKELANILNDLKCRGAMVYNPKVFFLAVVEKLAHFEMGIQHDSHEFLRCLLQALNEEFKGRHRTAITNSVEMAKKKNSEIYKSITEEEEEVKKFYLQQTCDTNSLSSIAEKLFCGSLHKSMQCQNCKNVVNRQELFYDLSVPIPIENTLKNQEPTIEELKSENSKTDADEWTSVKVKKIKKKTLIVSLFEKKKELSLDLCLDHFFSTELLMDDNKVMCENCTRNEGNGNEEIFTNTTLELKIAQPPKILIVHLKRFKFENGKLKKIPKFVSFPTLLDITKYCTNDCVLRNKRKPIIFALYAVEEHLSRNDSGKNGHYVSYRKISDENNCNNNNSSGIWLLTNDNKIQSVRQTEVLTAQAYILFYKLIFNDSDN